MKLHFLSSVFACILAGCMFSLPSCSEDNKFDDTELRSEINELKKRVDALETVKKALEGKLLITDVQSTSDGYIITFSDGSKATIINNKVQDIPEPEECYIREITVLTDRVVFYLTDGKSIEIPIAGAIDITFEETEALVMVPGQTRHITYNVTSETGEIEIEALSSADVKVMVVPLTEDKKSGTLDIELVSEPDEYSKVIVIANNGQRVVMRRFSFSDTGVGVYDNTQKETSFDSRSLELEFVSDEMYKVEIPASAESWISLAASRALEKRTITLELAQNMGSKREADIVVRSTSSPMSVTFHVVQNADYKSSERRAAIDLCRAAGFDVPDNTPIGQLPGITTDENEHVTEAWFFGFKGDIPSSIGELTELKKLDCSLVNFSSVPEELALLTKLEVLRFNAAMEGTRINGLIPEVITKIKSLKLLDLSRHGITGLPAGFTTMDNLETIVLEQCNLQTNILEDLVKMPNLKKIHIYLSKMSGSIPENIGNLSKLEELNLSCNNISGGFPASLFSLSELRKFSIQSNKLSGQIPDEFSRLSKLELLALSNNDFSGNIPESLGNLTELKELLIFWCNLSGTLPSSFSRLEKLHTLHLTGNKLTGSLHGLFGNCKDLKNLDLSDNEFTGTIPEEIVGVDYLSLYRNKLVGPVPDGIYQRPDFNNRWGILLMENQFDLSNLKLKGPIGLDMYYDPEVTKPYEISEEYPLHRLTILFQWANSCPFFSDVLQTMKRISAKYSNSDVQIIGRTYYSDEAFVKEYNMPWPTYYTYQLDYPYYVVPTITVINNSGDVVFSDMLQDRADLEKTIEAQLAR